MASITQMASIRMAAAGVLAVVALGLVACGGGDSGGGEASSNQVEGIERGTTGGEQPETITLDGETANFRGRLDVSGQDSAQVEQGNFFFDPTVLEGEAGQTLTVQLDNTADLAHTFTISDQDVDTVVAGGESAEAEVTFPESGTVVFVCRFHEDQGMRGALQVAGEGEAEGGGEGERAGAGDSAGEGAGEGAGEAAGEGEEAGGTEPEAEQSPEGDGSDGGDGLY